MYEHNTFIIIFTGVPFPPSNKLTQAEVFDSRTNKPKPEVRLTFKNFTLTVCSHILHAAFLFTVSRRAQLWKYLIKYGRYPGRSVHVLKQKKWAFDNALSLIIKNAGKTIDVQTMPGCCKISNSNYWRVSKFIIGKKNLLSYRCVINVRKIGLSVADQG
jgi:hypothetical protein